ncbi:MAG: hypothetical protein RLZZ308_486 [Candidatus Parcubacteria bacterium]|jgi:hypothetical protein
MSYPQKRYSYHLYVCVRVSYLDTESILINGRDQKIISTLILHNKNFYGSKESSKESNKESSQESS